jgi:hypothetical protein
VGAIHITATQPKHLQNSLEAQIPLPVSFDFRTHLPLMISPHILFSIFRAQTFSLSFMKSFRAKNLHSPQSSAQSLAVCKE